MRLLPVTENDVSEINRLLEQNSESLGQPLLPLAEKLDLDSFMLLKIVRHSALAGFIELESLEGKNRLNCFVVDKKQRGCGVGRLALGLLFSFLVKKGCVRVSVLVNAKNSAAKRLYEEGGFYFVGLWQGNNIEILELEKEFTEASTQGIS